MYEYKFELEKVYDGDTVYGWIDLGMQTKVYKKIRLFGIQAPEVKTKNKEEKKKGFRSKEWLINVLSGEDIIIKTEQDKTGKYGRVLGTLFIGEMNVNEKALQTGMAKVYE